MVENIILPSCCFVFPGLDVLGALRPFWSRPFRTPVACPPPQARGGPSSCLTGKPWPRPAASESAFGQDPPVTWSTLKLGNAQMHPRTTISRCPQPAGPWAPPSLSRLSIPSQMAFQKGSRCVLPLCTPFHHRHGQSMRGGKSGDLGKR